MKANNSNELFDIPVNSMFSSIWVFSFSMENRVSNEKNIIFVFEKMAIIPNNHDIEGISSSVDSWSDC